MKNIVLAASSSFVGCDAATLLADRPPAEPRLLAPSYDLKQFFGERAPRRLDRLSELSLVAAVRCMNQVPFVQEIAEHERAVFFATRHGNLAGTIGFLNRLDEKGVRLASPIEFPNLVLSAPAGNLSHQFRCKGELLSFNQGQAGSLLALLHGGGALRRGAVKSALVVAADEVSEMRTKFGKLLGEPDRQGEGAVAVLLTNAQVEGPVLSGSALLGPGTDLNQSLRAAMAQALVAAELSAVDLACGPDEVLVDLPTQERLPFSRLSAQVGESPFLPLLGVSLLRDQLAQGLYTSGLVAAADESGAVALVLRRGVS